MLTNIEDIKTELEANANPCKVIYAFNGTGKTSLSRLFVKDNSSFHYNAYTEDLFTWDNNDSDYRLCVKESTLATYEQLSLNPIDESINNYLLQYNLNLDFQYYGDEKCFKFFKTIAEDSIIIKISRGEQMIFIFCFFLVLLDLGLQDNVINTVFIDDPVSSLDDNNVFITANILKKIINDNKGTHIKFYITTHHIFFFNLLYTHLKIKQKNFLYLYKQDRKLELKAYDDSDFSYHLYLIKKIKEDIVNRNIRYYHFVMIRQLLETIASFFGYSDFEEILAVIGLDSDLYQKIINRLSHDDIYIHKSADLVDDNKKLIRDVFDRICRTFHFK